MAVKLHITQEIKLQHGGRRMMAETRLFIIVLVVSAFAVSVMLYYTTLTYNKSTSSACCKQLTTNDVKIRHQTVETTTSFDDKVRQLNEYLQYRVSAATITKTEISEKANEEKEEKRSDDKLSDQKRYSELNSVRNNTIKLKILKQKNVNPIKSKMNEKFVRLVKEQESRLKDLHLQSATNVIPPTIGPTERPTTRSPYTCENDRVRNIIPSYKRTDEILAYMKTHCSVTKTYHSCEPTNLVGPMYVNKDHISFDRVYHDITPFVQKGGWWAPKRCKEKASTAIVIPFRNRYQHLPVLLRQLLPMLKRNFLHFRIFVIEQDDEFGFNRGKLMNVGFNEALKMFPYTCFVFHDVDLLPEDDRINYGCKHSPMHLSVAVDKFHYRLPYNSIFGGIEMFSTEDYKRANGFTNIFYSWGGEDDIMWDRAINKGMQIKRQSVKIARYTMLSHKAIDKTRSPADTARTANLMNIAKEHFDDDGLNSLQYKVKGIVENTLYTLIKVDLQKDNEKSFGIDL